MEASLLFFLMSPMSPNSESSFVPYCISILEFNLSVHVLFEMHQSAFTTQDEISPHSTRGCQMICSMPLCHSWYSSSTHFNKRLLPLTTISHIIFIYFCNACSNAVKLEWLELSRTPLPRSTLFTSPLSQRTTICISYALSFQCM